MTNRTLLDAWEAFEASSPKYLSLHQTALFRFTVPGLEGRKRPGSRLKSKEIAGTLKALASTSISPDIEEKLREAQRQTFSLLNTSKKRQRQLRCYLNQFIAWAIKNNFFPTVKLSEEKNEYTFLYKKISHVKTSRRGKLTKFAFSFDVNDYANEPLGYKEIEHHIRRISEEFNSFKKYQITIQNNREITANNREIFLRRILGWLYRKKNMALAELSLKNLVPYVRLKFKIQEFSSDENPWFSQLIAKAKALEDIKDEANCLVDLMSEYFAWLENPPSTKTKQDYIESLIAYAKYIYRSETDKTMALNFEDIPLINRLKVFQKEVGNGKKNNSKSSIKYLPWPNVLEVLEKLRFEADLKTHKNGTRRNKRSAKVIASSLQDFVLMGFFLLVPPSRQRVVRELELGKTLEYGIYENGRFISFDKMVNPDDAKYYIHLQPEDYKTGDTYGEWLGEFPNTEFSDGSKFYDYLNRWLFQGYQDANGDWHGMRELIAIPGEKTVFVSNRLGQSYTPNLMRAKIKRIFVRWTGVSIGPHDLRHIYRTYIDHPTTGATTEERESAAFWMRHSKQMAEDGYSHLECEEKLWAGAQLSSRINKLLLSV